MRFLATLACLAAGWALIAVASTAAALKATAWAEDGEGPPGGVGRPVETPAPGRLWTTPTLHLLHTVTHDPTELLEP